MEIYLYFVRVNELYDSISFFSRSVTILMHLVEVADPGRESDVSSAISILF